MGKLSKTLAEEHKEFIGRQHVFFLASCSGKEVNLSPKGYDTLRVLDEETLLFLDYPGSGDRTARDIEAKGEATIMFCAFEGAARILRLFCTGTPVEKEDSAFVGLAANFHPEDVQTARRIVAFSVYAVETSCGKSVPFFEYKGEREELKRLTFTTKVKGLLKDFIHKHRTPPSLDTLRDENISKARERE